MNAKTAIISLLLLAAGVAVGVWMRGASDAKGWTAPVTT